MSAQFSRVASESEFRFCTSVMVKVTALPGSQPLSNLKGLPSILAWVPPRTPPPMKPRLLPTTRKVVARVGSPPSKMMSTDSSFTRLPLATTGLLEPVPVLFTSLRGMVASAGMNRPSGS